MKYVTYKIRWLILAGILISAINRQLTVSAFAIRNADVALFFRASPYQIDLLSIGDSILAVFACLVLSVIGKHVGVRAQCMIAASCLTVGNLLVCVGFTSRDLYLCVATGRFLSGVSVGVLYILPGAFANAWFPITQVGTAFCVTFLGFNSGGATSTLIFSFEFPETDIHNSSSKATTADRIENVGSWFTIVFGISTAVLLVITIVFGIFSKDRPPSPPSEAEALLPDREKKPNFNLRSDMSDSVNLFRSRPFLLLTLGNFLCTSALVSLLVLMPSLVAATFPRSNVSSHITTINLCSFLLAVCFSFGTGRLLDRTRSYKSVSCVGSFMAAAFAIGVCLGHHFKSLVGLSIFYPLMFVSRISNITAYAEFLIEATYPYHKTVLVSLHFAFYNAAFFVMTTVERATFNNWGPTSAIIVPIVGNILGGICVLFVEPDYRRSRVSVG